MCRHSTFFKNYFIYCFYCITLYTSNLLYILIFYLFIFNCFVQRTKCASFRCKCAIQLTIKKHLYLNHFAFFQLFDAERLFKFALSMSGLGLISSSRLDDKKDILGHLKAHVLPCFQEHNRGRKTNSQTNNISFFSTRYCILKGGIIILKKLPNFFEGYKQYTIIRKFALKADSNQVKTLLIKKINLKPKG